MTHGEMASEYQNLSRVCSETSSSCLDVGLIDRAIYLQRLSACYAKQARILMGIEE